MPGPGNAQYGDSGLLTFAANWIFGEVGGTGGGGAIGRTPAGEDRRPKGVYVGDDGITFADGTQQTTAAVASSGMQIVGMTEVSKQSAVPYTLQIPSSIAADDLAISWCSAAQEAGDSLTFPAGWTSIINRTHTTANILHTGVAYRVITGAEGASFQWTKTTGGGDGCAGVIFIRGADISGTPINVSGSAETAAASLGPFNAPSVVTTVNNAIVLRLTGQRGSVLTAPLKAGDYMRGLGVNDLIDYNNVACTHFLYSRGTLGAAGVYVNAGFEIQASAGASGARAFYTQANSSGGAVATIAIAPA